MTPAAGKRRGLLALCLLGGLLFTTLGVWQLQRLQWKRALIARVDAHARAAPRAMPASTAWAALDAREDEYRRVRATGVFRHDSETLVDALTAIGPGAWVLTPLQTADGLVLVNRGFVPPERKSPVTRADGQVAGTVTVVGLLRPTEPDGRILRPNDPAAGRWFSRDVRAIAASRGLGAVAPFFIDADATANPGGWPVGGLTVVRFRNAHLPYALTWFALAALCGAGGVLVVRQRVT